MLFPGPKYTYEQDFKYRLEQLSKQFCGVVITSTPEAVNKKFGDFTLRTYKHPEKGKLLFHVKYSIWVLLYAISERARKSGVSLVISYDPLLTGLLGLIVAKILGVKFMTELNGDYADKYNYCDQANKSVAVIKRFIYTRLAKFVLRKSDGIRQIYPKQMYYLDKPASAKIITLFDYVDLRGFENLGEDKIILFAGFPFYRKGVDVLIKAFKIASKDYPDWELKILGWFPDMKELNECISGHPGIFHHPPVPHKEMPIHVGRCAFVVLPSRSEGLARILLEAMVAGKPRIGSKVSGTPAAINDNEDGLLFESENHVELADKMKLLMSDAGLREKLGNQAHKRALHEFSLERYFREIMEFYSSLIRE